MSRLHLIVLFFLGVCPNLFAQNKLGTYLKHAEEKFAKGDYYYAVELYENAMQIDSNAVAILWNYAEALKAYKDYRKAEYYYAKVYDKESSSIYPSSLLNLGLMQKQNGKYQEALETFKKVKSKSGKDKKAYLYLKAKREIESCLWAQTASKDTLQVNVQRLPESVNSSNTEFGHNMYDGQFIFSSLRADSISSSEEVYGKEYRTTLYSSQMEGSAFGVAKQIEALALKNAHVGNGTFSLDGKRFYFSACQSKGHNYTCKLMVAKYANGKWTDVDSLGELINVGNANTTMPSIANFNGNEVLFFASDRPDGKGGMDIWYSQIKNGNQFSKPINVSAINSLDNELSPWWSSKDKQLYFSSSWHDGFGGYDIFRSPYKDQFTEPQNLGLPYNSPANDMYYFMQGDTSYFSSNRVGVLFSKNPTCCNDIFSVTPIEKEEPPTPKETLAELNKRLPVTLYFHNDCPDPKSRDTLTRINYINGYADYRDLLEKYQQEYSTGLSADKAIEAKEDIESFFIEYVDQGVKDLELFRDLLLQELNNGAKINITVKGFASPLAKTDYNVNLTKRRISSLVNYLREYKGGVFVPYLNGNAANGGKVIFTQVPFGEYTANKLTSDNFHDQKNSVYSRAAAIERKIEIQSVDYLVDDSLLFITEISPRFIDLAAIKRGGAFNKRITIKNKSTSLLTIEKIIVHEELISVTGPQVINPSSSISIEFINKQLLPKGLFSFPVTIYVNGYPQPITVMVNGEGFD